jgi:hypothetical protein
VDFKQAQKYYTNQNSDFSVKVGSRLNNSSDASQNDSLSLAQLNTNLQQPQMERMYYRVVWNAFDLNASYFKLKLLRLRL